MPPKAARTQVRQERGQADASIARSAPPGAAVEGQAEGSLRLEPSGSQAQCSFCGLEGRQVRHLVASGLAVAAGKFGELPRICDRCRDLGLEILAEPSPA